MSPDSLGTTTQSSLFLYFGVGDVSITPAIFGRAVLFVTTSNLSDVILVGSFELAFFINMPSHLTSSGKSRLTAYGLFLVDPVA